VRACLDRFYKEALLNIVKHARAQHVNVSLFRHGTTIVCAVEDDGVGFDTTAELDGHYGLANMRRRVEELGGRVLIRSGDGVGTRLTVELPLS
jgi:signal transduction histidine kinase